MSNTYSVGKKVAAVVAPNGVIYYALFEQTYESNVHPQVPHWCAIFFGTAEACMKRIIDYAGACEGGCLKEQGGWTTPSAYLKHWRNAMANPLELTTRTISVPFGEGLHALKPSKRDATEAALATHGHKGIEGENLSLTLPDDCAVLQAVIEAGNSAWKFLRPGSYRVPESNWAAYAPFAKKVGRGPDATVWFIDPCARHEREYWIEVDGAMQNTGWAYSTIQKLIASYAVDSEQRLPGSAESAIRWIRRAVKAAQVIPPTQRVVIERDKGTGHYNARAFVEMLGTLGGPADAATIDTTVGAILAANALYALRALPDVMVTFPGLSIATLPLAA